MISDYYNTTIQEENVTVDFPNRDLFVLSDQQKFWKQQILNEFAFYDWKNNDKQKIDTLKKI